MKKSIGYYILMAATWPMQLFPLKFHYLISDVCYLFLYHLVGYRRKVVAKNLQNSFPDKSTRELKQIERKFYHHFIDLFIETFYLTHITQKRHAKRLVFENKELIDDLYKKGKSVVCITGHYGNWEFSRLFSIHVKHQLYAIYKKQSIKVFDRFFKDVRAKDGATLLEMKQTYRQLVSDTREGINYFAVFIADQRPLEKEIQFWMPFLNQDTPVLLGPEKIAKKTDAAVVWAEMHRLKRGYNKIVFKLITETPRQTEEFEITQKFMNHLEEVIVDTPELWLWTHNRWKYKRS